MGKSMKSEFFTDAQCWRLNGKWHREKGPAIFNKDGYKIWYRNIFLHRLDGPADITKYGCNFWYINGIQITKYKRAKLRIMLTLGLDKI
jgi:hypothetical protein